MVCLACGFAACGDTSGRADAQPEVDPQSVVDRTGTSALTTEERELLARARGREWVDLRAVELEALLLPDRDSATAVFVWDPATGAPGIQHIQLATRELDTLGARVAVAVIAGGRERDELVALRESQAVLPAYRIPGGAMTARLGGGRVAPGYLLVSGTPNRPRVLTVDSPDAGALRDLLVERRR